MNVRTEIAERVAKLSPQLQEQVLVFVSSLEASALKGESGAALARFAGSLDDVSAHEMTQAIEEECERVDARQW
jgi:acetolactate synthase small subunit